MSASRPDSYTTLKPWLTVPQLFSLTWLAYPILSLLFVAFRLQISSDQAQNAVEDAKGTLLTSCRAAEKAATSAASLPRFLAEGTNSQFVDAVNATINGARGALILALTCMQAIIEFVIDIYRSTFLCFLELIIRGSLSLLINASEEATQFVQNALQTIGNGLRDQVSSVNGAINSAVDAINKVGGIFGGGVNIPQVNLNLDSLANVQIPNTIADGLTQLNSTIPTMDELRDAIDRVIGIPFDLVKKEINDTMLGITFDSSVLPVPQQNTVEFCSSLDVSVVDRLGADLIKITKIAIILVVIIAVLLILANCLFEWYKNKCLLDNFERTRDAWSTNPLVTQSGGSVPSVPLTDNNLRELHVFSSHPLFMWLCNKFTAFCRMRPGQVVYMRWFFCYVLHPPALACLLIGLLGLISVQLQLAAIAPLQAKYEGEVSNTVSDFTSVIGDHINEAMRRDSQAYATAVNSQMDGIQTTINDGLFGWVEGTTTVLNNTVVTFYNEVQHVVETVFGGTPLEAPVEQFVHCLIGSKVEAIEHALTFLHDNLHVNLPRAKDDVLMISQQSMTEVAQPISLAAVGDQTSGESDGGGLVGKLVLRYVEALKKERMMFFIFLGLWGFVVLMALAIMFWHAFIHPAIERRRKKKWHQEARDLGDSPWLATMADEKAKPAVVTPPPALGFSTGREKERSWEDDKQSASSSFNSASKLVAWYNKHRGAGDSTNGDEERPSLWERLKAIFCGRKVNDDDDDWSSNPPKVERSLPRPISPAKPAEDTASVSTVASIPRRKLPPPLSPIQAPVEAVRFPPPPQRVAPAPVPLHLSFAGQAPEEPTFRPLAPTPPKEQPVRNSTTELEAQRLRSVNPFTTPFDGHEESPFAHPTDPREDTPFTNQHMRRPQPPTQPTPSYPAGRFI